MTFATDLAALPYEARQQDASGFLPPITRAVSHLTFVLAHENEDEATPRHIQDEEALNELKHAQLHWGQITGTEVISATASGHIANYGKAIDSALAEWDGWNREARITNLRDLGNRAVGLMAALDRELVGLRGSDPGYTL